jgi:hypothetical protein
MLLRKSGIVRDAAFPLPTSDKIAEYQLFLVFYFILAVTLLCYGDHIARLFYGTTKTLTPPDAANSPSTDG